jgi:putative DNA primase/helicase
MTPTRVEQFRAAIHNAGMHPPEVIEPDGKLHRFASNGKRSDDAGWYVLHDDAIPAGAFGDWRTGASETWRADIGRRLLPQEEAAHRARVDAMRREREAEDAQRKAEARERAAAIWKQAEVARPDHPYLAKKRISPVATIRELPIEKLVAILGYPPRSRNEALIGRVLVVPVKVGDRLSTVELIDEQGRKHALAGGEKRAGYWTSRPLPDCDDGLVLLVGEGVATVLSAAKATGYHPVAALTSGNLSRVAEQLRSRNPEARIVVLADLGNGQQAAEEAARAVSGRVALPDFGPDRPDGATDFNDLAEHRGLEVVRACIEGARAPDATPQPKNEKVPAPATASGIAYRRASEIQAKPIRWLWKGRIARGKVSMLAGNPGLGKSQVTASMAAIVSTGGEWPVDRTRCERGNVIILSAEDDAEDTIRPRLEAAGADLSRVYLLDAVVEGYRATDGGEVIRAFNLKTDLPRLATLLEKIGDVALIVIDPITAYLGDTDSHVNAEVRALLARLSEMAGKSGAAVVCVSHLNKGGNSEALMRVTGSLAFVAAARAAYIVVKDQEDGNRRLFLPLKNNVGNDQTGLAFTVQGAQVASSAGLIETACVVWEAEAVTVTADEAMARPIDSDERSAVEDAMQFLRDLLAKGPMPAKQVYAEGREAGHAERTLRRAQKGLGIEPTKAGVKEGWKWAMAPKAAKNAEDGQPIRLATLGNVGHLGEAAPAAEEF